MRVSDRPPPSVSGCAGTSRWSTHGVTWGRRTNAGAAGATGARVRASRPLTSCPLDMRHVGAHRVSLLTVLAGRGGVLQSRSGSLVRPKGDLSRFLGRSAIGVRSRSDPPAQSRSRHVEGWSSTTSRIPDAPSRGRGAENRVSIESTARVRPERTCPAEHCAARWPGSAGPARAVDDVDPAA